MKITLSSLLLLTLILLSACSGKQKKHRVIITTDIQVCCGDPDDIQSLCHVLWYADVLDIRAIIPEKFGRGEEPGGITAAERVIEKYRLDYQDSSTHFQSLGFPEPDYLLNEVLQTERNASIDKIIEEANASRRPLYILVWGNMNILKDALLKAPEIAEKIRVLTIGTNLRAPSDGGDGAIPNWNGPGRNRIFGDPAFDEIWWVENDWGYNGMFSGLEYPEEGGRPIGGRPFEIMNELAEKGGHLGQHLREVVSLERVNWAYFFRAGDTPTVLYLIDPDNDSDNPAHGSWAGIFQQPFQEDRPNYWTNVDGESKFEFTDPLHTWHYADEAIEASYQHLLNERDEMYEALLEKIARLYGN
ncbi:nucleoside hydrolase-like domain-containing protein [Bacteroidota bacterium]